MRDEVAVAVKGSLFPLRDVSTMIVTGDG